MTKDNKIISPKGNHREDTLRTWLEATLQLVPLPYTGILGTLGNHFLPSKQDRERKLWEEKITSLINSHQNLLDTICPHNQEMLSEKAGVLMICLLQLCPDGLYQLHYELEKLEEITDIKGKELKKAIYELNKYGLIKVRDVVNKFSIRLTPESYLKMDYLSVGFDTYRDSIALAEMMLAENSGSVPSIEKKLEWQKRRTNPALRLLLEKIPERYIRTPIQPDYEVLGISMTEEVNFILEDYTSK